MSKGDADRPTAAAGWYPVADGRLRWWDGAGWHEPPQQHAPERPLATLPHLGFFVMPVIGAVALRLTLGKSDPFMKHHASEAVNAQIWFAIIWNAVGWPIFVYLIRSGEPNQLQFLELWLVMVVIFVFNAALSVVGAVMAYREVWWRNPLIPYRFVRGAQARAH